MAFTTDNLLSDGDIEVVLRVDSALEISDKGDDDDEYDEYLKNGLDEGKLKFKAGEEPTRFIMRRNITLKHATRIENAKMKYGADGEVSVQLGFIIEEVRASLKGVKNPASVPKDKELVLKFTGDGLVDDRQMAALISAGVVQNLFAARQAALKATTGGDLKKS
jgi:hypothetical protein